MKNFWKRFGVWVTELRNNPFSSARFKFTFFYSVMVLLVAIFAANLANISERVILKSTIDGDGPLKESVVQSILAYHSAVTWEIVIFALIVVTLISFFISGKALAPIQQIVRTQKRFIADASHELRTPLAIMKTNTEVTLLDEQDGQEAVATLKSNLEEVDRMSKIIENLLSLSYYDNRVSDIPFIPVNLSELATHIAERSRSLAVKKSINLRILNTDPGYINGNPIALEQMAINLIKNAVTYTEPGGQVSVSVANRGDMMEFKVKDSGIGIAEKDLPHVFSPFYKAGFGRMPLERESSGLGLTIVKKIVERHSGLIYLNSKVGKGTTISISFPRLENAELSAS